MNIDTESKLRRTILRPRAALLLIAALVAALSIATVVPSGKAQPAATAAAATSACNGLPGSADCFQLWSQPSGEIGISSSSTSDFSQAPVESASVRPDTTDWALFLSADKTSVMLRNFRSNNLCLAVSAAVTDGHLADCGGGSRFRITMTTKVNAAKFVSVDNAGYCLRDIGEVAYPGALTSKGGTDLHPCGDDAGEIFVMSGPTSGTSADWPRDLALKLAFANCNDTPQECTFEPDDPNAEPTFRTQPAGCLDTRDNTTSPTDGTLSMAYSKSKQASQRLGTSVDKTTGIEYMELGNGATTTFGWNAYENHSYTHVKSDTYTYAVKVPPKMFGWLADTEYVDVQPGTYTFDRGTSYEWSDHRSNYAFADLAADHPYGHRVVGMVGLNLPTDCKLPTTKGISSYYFQNDRTGQLLTAFPYALPADPTTKTAKVGFAFKTGAKSIRVSDLSRLHLPPSRLDGSSIATCSTCTRDHLVQLAQIDASGNILKVLLGTYIDERGVAADAPGQPVWGDSYLTPSGACAVKCPVVLQPNTEYAVMSIEGYGDNFAQGKLTIDPDSGVTVLGPVMWDSDGFKSNATAPLSEWGGANLTFSTS